MQNSYENCTIPVYGPYWVRISCVRSFLLALLNTPFPIKFNLFFNKVLPAHGRKHDIRVRSTSSCIVTPSFEHPNRRDKHVLVTLLVCIGPLLVLGAHFMHFSHQSPQSQKWHPKRIRMRCLCGCASQPLLKMLAISPNRYRKNSLFVS